MTFSKVLLSKAKQINVVYHTRNKLCVSSLLFLTVLVRMSISKIQIFQI